MPRLRTILLLIRKDLTRRRRSPLGVLALIAFPLVFSTMLALAFSGGGGESIIRAKLLVEDRDGGLAGGMIKNFLRADQLSDFLEVVEVGEEGLALIEDNQASALLRIPKGASQDLANGKAVALELIRNPAQGILPEVAEQVTAILADVLSIFTGVLRSQVENLNLAGALEDGIDLDDLDDLGDVDFAKLAVSLRRTFEEISTFIDEPPLAFEMVQAREEPPAEDQEDDDSSPFNIFLFIFPGISVYSLFLIGDQMMRDILTETQLGTLKRLLSAPISAGQIVAAKALVTAMVASVVLVLLAAIAAFMTTTRIHLPGFVLLSFALVLAVTGFAVAIYSLARTENQGSTFSSLFYLLMGFAGGSFLPLNNLPTAMRSAAPVSPFYWGTQGFQRLLNGDGLSEILGSIAVLGASGLMLLTVGTLLLQKKVLRGDA